LDTRESSSHLLSRAVFQGDFIAHKDREQLDSLKDLLPAVEQAALHVWWKMHSIIGGCIDVKITTSSENDWKACRLLVTIKIRREK
jgi:hypothetical protein